MAGRCGKHAELISQWGRWLHRLVRVHGVTTARSLARQIKSDQRWTETRFFARGVLRPRDDLRRRDEKMDSLVALGRAEDRVSATEWPERQNSASTKSTRRSSTSKRQAVRVSCCVAGSRPNENKMSDGGPERALLAVEMWKSSQKWSVWRSAVRSIA